MRAQLNIFGEDQSRLNFSHPPTSADRERPTPSKPEAILSLSERYQPRTIDDFVGLEKPKLLMRGIRHRQGGAYLFYGRSGTGKTAFALAVAAELDAEVLRLVPRDCTRPQLRSLATLLLIKPQPPNQRRLILLEHVDRLNPTQQHDLRSSLDSRGNVIWIGTAVDMDKLEDGFASRWSKVHFSAYGSSTGTAFYLEHLWERETSGKITPRPDFARIAKESKGDMRIALSRLEQLISPPDVF